MMQMHTVAAGGGSICRFDGMRFRVGPESAGANPGPACYRNGGPLTVTDCNLFLGRIDPRHIFPAVFGPDGDQPLDLDAALARIAEVADAVEQATGQRRTTDEIARGFLAIANDNMANAIRKISIARGHDVTRYALACFGGAGGQHACPVADALGMERIIVHPLGGGAVGLRDRARRREGASAKGAGCGRSTRTLPLRWAVSRTQRRRRCASRAIDAGRIVVERRARLRTAGSDTSIEIAVAPVASDARRVPRASPRAVRLRRRGRRAGSRLARRRSAWHRRCGGGAVVPDRARLARRRCGELAELRSRRHVRRSAHRRPGADHRSRVDDGSRPRLARAPRRATGR